MTAIFTRAWLGYAGERALKTAIQTFAACLATNSIFSAMDWGVTLSIVLSATIASVATSINSTSLAPGQADVSSLPPIPMPLPLPPVVTDVAEKVIDAALDVTKERVVNNHTWNVSGVSPEQIANDISRQVTRSLDGIGRR